MIKKECPINVEMAFALTGGPLSNYNLWVQQISLLHPIRCGMQVYTGLIIGTFYLLLISASALVFLYGVTGRLQPFSYIIAGSTPIHALLQFLFK